MMRLWIPSLALLLGACTLTQGPSDLGVSRGEYIPADLDDALRHLDVLLTEKEIEEIRAMSDEEMFLGQTHQGLGRWMRNNWGLWRGGRLASYFNEIGIHHPDDMSAIILTSYHRRLHDNPIELEEQVAYYQAYWKRIEEQHEAVEGSNQ